jgi:hypothetical protein
VTDRPPDFDELVGGDDLAPDERERLRRVHDLLVAAGPPAELPPALATSEHRDAAVVPIRRPSRRRLAVAAVLAAALALAAFGVGYFVGDSGDDGSAEAEFVLAMTGPGASASLMVFHIDKAGNWPMKMTVQGLPELPTGQRYELWLTKQGKLSASCGRFVVGKGRTIVPLNAPYRLKQFDGWVVTRAGSDEPLLHTV